MAFPLAYALCLVCTSPGAIDASPSQPGLALQSPSPRPPVPGMDLGSELFQHQHGDDPAQGDSGQAGHGMMGSTMIVVMVVMMVVVGGAIMMRGARASPAAPIATPAALAIPVTAPRALAPGG